MNNRQKLVQQQYLNNEQAVIKRLQQVYGQSLKDIDDKIEKLMKRFDPETGDLPQSVIYQIKYQQMLKGQIEGILKEMQTKQFLTVSDYLDTCYEDGFVGSLFDLHGQGVPMAIPLNQESLVKAVQLDSKISQGLYTRLGEDVDLLKKKITAQVSRSIATGTSFEQTAKQLAGYTNIGYNNAIRIARTEGHRIQCSASHDVAQQAKDRGADIVKKWDATLDGKTRESHAAVDGEIREVDEPFSNGLMFPGDPAGSAAEVINCRCAYLQKARRWLEDSFTKMNNFTGQLETFESPKTYAEFKKGFFSQENKKYMNYVQQLEDKYKTKNFEKVLDQMSDREYKHYSKLLGNNPMYNPKKTVTKPKPFKEITNALDFEYGGLTQDDYIKWMDDYDAHNKHVKLSAEELKIIDDYTEGSFIALNDVSRYSDEALLKKGYTAEDITRIRKNADILEGALSKYDLDTDIVTHRFERDVSWLTGNGNSIEELEKLIGTEYTTDGFTSSGMLPNRFRFTGGKSDAVHFEIITPKGTDGAFLSMSRKGENEFLYNRNTRYKVLDGGERIVKEQKMNFKTWQMEEVEIKERFLKVQAIVDDIDDLAEEVVEAATKKVVFTPANVDDFPALFQKTKVGKAATQKLVDTLNSVSDLNPNIRKLYTQMDKLPHVPATGKVSFTKDDHALDRYGNPFTGETTEYRLKLPKLEGDDLSGETGVAFHEIGHYIDMGLTDKKMKSQTHAALTDAFTKSGSSMSPEIKVVLDDFNDQCRKMTSDLSAKYSTMRNQLNDDYFAKKLTYKEYDKQWKALIREEKTERDYMTRNLGGGGVDMLSDIYDALSGGAYQDNRTLFYGHGGAYYSQSGKQNSETFANYMSLCVNRPDLVEMLRKDKPELCDALDKMIEEMAGELK